MTNEMDHPLVSIVIPTYNGEEYLAETIDSVLHQTLSDFEVIMCDDASQDHTSQILKKYSERDPRIIVFQFSENIGLAGNWNRGLKRAEGTYVKILCQDDLIKPTYLEETVEIMENYNETSLMCSFEQTVGDKIIERSFEAFPGTEEVEGRKAQNQILSAGNWIGAPSATLFRRSALSKVGLFDEKLPCGLDWEMWLRLLGLGNLYVIPTPLYSTRIHSKQETSNCIQNLGFIKDKISIVHKIQSNPKLYGREQWKINKKEYKKTIYKLVNATLNKKSLNISDLLRFLSQYQSNLSSISVVFQAIMSRVLRSIRSGIRFGK